MLGVIPGGMSYSEYGKAAERGRQMALARLRECPDVRIRLEIDYGLDTVRSRYPELYKDKAAIARWRS